jgi:hypothetical protein
MQHMTSGMKVISGMELLVSAIELRIVVQYVPTQAALIRIFMAL